MLYNGKAKWSEAKQIAFNTETKKFPQANELPWASNILSQGNRVQYVLRKNPSEKKALRKIKHEKEERKKKE